MSVKISVTGAAGQIGYSLLFRIASGSMFGADTPVRLQLLEIPPAMSAVEGVMMELEDCAFPLLESVSASDDPNKAFEGTDCAILVGSRPRTKGMERKDLLEANAAIFSVQGKALQESAADNVRALVVGNPANTNCLILKANAPDIPADRFAAMTRLDHNRAISQIAAKLGCPTTDIKKMTIWGNHSATQYPDLYNCEVGGKSAAESVNDEGWIKDEFIPAVQQRGAAIIEARGSSSAASAANAAVDCIRDWADKTPKDDWASLAVFSDGSYGVPEGIISSFPCTSEKGDWQIVQGLDINDFSRERIDASTAELVEEREAVESLGLLG